MTSWIRNTPRPVFVLGLLRSQFTAYAAWAEAWSDQGARRALHIIRPDFEVPPFQRSHLGSATRSK